MIYHIALAILEATLVFIQPMSPTWYGADVIPVVIIGIAILRSSLLGKQLDENHFKYPMVTVFFLMAWTVFILLLSLDRLQPVV